MVATIPREIIRIVYLDDEPDWLELVEIELRKKHLLDEFEYIPISTIDDLETYLEFESTIFIFDLKLVDIAPQHEGLEWLEHNAASIISKQKQDIFVLSGNLQPTMISQLMKHGIGREHIFRKEPWKKNIFINQIESSINSLRSEDGRSNEINHPEVSSDMEASNLVGEYIVEFEVSFQGFRENQHLIWVKPNIDYDLSITTNVLQGIWDHQEIVNQPIEVIIFGDGLETEPDPIKFTILDSSGTTMNVPLRFLNIGETEYNRLTVIIYFNNHILQIFEFDVKVS